ncbi:hypothetical protein [Paenibacillus sp. FSL H7-0326]|uniref:hypothetical protein n=1 Tax=Paenibacillus sp. FSL H7-0326 TaxID=1921144 RepID=UPI00117F61AC|nr:hypothetical protein [Paenibacillus sp. FSL H7-0326]
MKYTSPLSLKWSNSIATVAAHYLMLTAADLVVNCTSTEGADLLSGLCCRSPAQCNRDVPSCSTPSIACLRAAATFNGCPVSSLVGCSSSEPFYIEDSSQRSSLLNVNASSPAVA